MDTKKLGEGKMQQVSDVNIYKKMSHQSEKILMYSFKF